MGDSPTSRKRRSSAICRRAPPAPRPRRLGVSGTSARRAPCALRPAPCAAAKTRTAPCRRVFGRVFGFRRVFGRSIVWSGGSCTQAGLYTTSRRSRRMTRRASTAESAGCAWYLSQSSGAAAELSPPASDQTCPISTEGWTRRVHFVREGGGGRGRRGEPTGPHRPALDRRDGLHEPPPCLGDRACPPHPRSVSETATRGAPRGRRGAGQRWGARAPLLALGRRENPPSPCAGCCGANLPARPKTLIQ